MIAEALALATEIATPNLPVQLTPEEADAELASGHPVALIGPPNVEYPTFNQADATWTLTLISPKDRLEAWAQLDELTAVLITKLDVERVVPIEWRRPDGGVYGGYNITFATHHDLT